MMVGVKETRLKRLCVLLIMLSLAPVVLRTPWLLKHRQGAGDQDRPIPSLLEASRYPDGIRINPAYGTLSYVYTADGSHSTGNTTRTLHLRCEITFMKRRYRTLVSELVTGLEVITGGRCTRSITYFRGGPVPLSASSLPHGRMMLDVSPAEGLALVYGLPALLTEHITTQDGSCTGPTMGESLWECRVPYGSTAMGTPFAAAAVAFEDGGNRPAGKGMDSGGVDGGLLESSWKDCRAKGEVQYPLVVRDIGNHNWRWESVPVFNTGLQPGPPAPKSGGEPHRAMNTGPDRVDFQKPLPDSNFFPGSLTVSWNLRSNHPDGDDSGPEWTDRYPTGMDISDLEPAFGSHFGRFLAALKAAGAKVKIDATYRPPERAYLMHWSWCIAHEKYDPRNVPPYPGVDICWVHRDQHGKVDLNASREAAARMAARYSLAVEPVLVSRHTLRQAVDMNVEWSGPLKIKTDSGQPVKVTGPTNGATNGHLWEVGKTYGVIKLTSDPPHWSVDGH